MGTPAVYVTEDRLHGMEALKLEQFDEGSVPCTSVLVSDASSAGVVFLRRDENHSNLMLARIGPKGDMYVRGGLDVGGDIAFSGGMYTGGLDGGAFPDPSPWISDQEKGAVVLDDSNIEFNVGIGTSDPRHRLHVVGGGVVADSFSGAMSFSNLYNVPRADGNSPDRSGIVRLINSSSNTATDAAPTASALKAVRDESATRVNRSGDTMTGTLTMSKGSDLVVEDGGRLGIGTGSPDYTLSVKGDINFTGDMLRNGSIYPPPGTWEELDGRVFMMGSNVGIGTTDPRSPLQVQGDIDFSGHLRRGGNVVTFPWKGGDEDGKPSQHVVYLGESNVGIGVKHPTYKLQVEGGIYSSREVVSFSDSNYKEDLEPIDGALDRVCALTGYTFCFKDDVDGVVMRRRHAGVLAQEMMEVLPEVVTKDAETGRYAVSYGNVVALLIEAIKELRKERNNKHYR